MEGSARAGNADRGHQFRVDHLPIGHQQCRAEVSLTLNKEHNRPAAKLGRPNGPRRLNSRQAFNCWTRFILTDIRKNFRFRLTSRWTSIRAASP